MNQALWDQVQTQSSVASGRITYDHDGNTGVQAIGGGALGGALGYLTFAALDSTNKKELPYVQELNEQVRDNIYAVLKQNTLFKFDVEKSVMTVEEFPQKLKQDGINQLIEVKGLSCVLEIKVYFTHKDNFENRLAMFVQWYFHGRDPKQDIKVETWTFSDQKSGLLPNTRNPIYKDQYIQLATQSAQELIRVLKESAAKP